jgi:hypothetical protein
MIVRKSPAELEKMRRSGLLVHSFLSKLAGMVEVGRFDPGFGGRGREDDERRWR